MSKKYFTVFINLIFLLSILLVSTTSCCLPINQTETPKEIISAIKTEQDTIHGATVVEAATVTVVAETTAEETKKSIEDIVFYVIDENFQDMFVTLPSEAANDIKVGSADPAKIEIINNILYPAISKYPEGFLVKHLDRIYIFSYIRLEDKDIAGTYLLHPDRVYVVMDPPSQTDESFEAYASGAEKTFHAEVSSILLRKDIKDPAKGVYSKYFNEEAWLTINPEGFEYNQKIDSSVYDPELFKEGFIYPYAKKSIEEDFNSIIKNAFTDVDVFWDAVKEHKKLRYKLDLAVDFYKYLDPWFEDFFEKQYIMHGL